MSTSTQTPETQTTEQAQAQPAQAEIVQRKTRKGVLVLSAVVVGMFAFAMWGMPPFYDAICRITGLNGKVTAAVTQEEMAKNAANYKSESLDASSSALINVQFIADTDPAMPWSFKADMRGVRVARGQQQLVTFTVHNPTNKDMIGQAIPSVSPAEAMQYLRKIECFCFQKQPLKAGETRQLTMVFYLDKTLPKTLPMMTLAYKLFDITDKNQSS